MTGTPSRRQLRRREAEWRGSRRQSPGPRNTNRIGGERRWARERVHLKPEVIRNRRSEMRRAHGAKVTRLTPGDLHVCLEWLGPSRDSPRDEQESAEAVVAAAHDGEGPNTRSQPAPGARGVKETQDEG